MSTDISRPLPLITRSTDLLRRAESLIPAATQTLAKGPGQHVRGVSPAFAQRAKGAHLWDVDGNCYLDYTMAVGPVILGYGHAAVDEAITSQLHDGITFSLVHPLEVEVAELLQEIVPNAEMFKYSKTGCDVTSAAVRLARAHTGRSTVLCCGYHGWHDWYIGVTDRSAGIPSVVRDSTFTFGFNDIDSVMRSIDDDTAAIILEPMVFDLPSATFLHELRSICDDRGIILIFDEMWTGFRVALGGAQERFGVHADLVCFSKAVANGMPLSVLTGRADIMRRCEQDVFFYTTFGGEALSLAAAKATLQFLRDYDVPRHIEACGDVLRTTINEQLDALDMPYVRCKGLGSRLLLAFDPMAGDPLLMKSFVHQELLRYGILWNGTHNLSYAHTAHDIGRTVQAYSDILPRLNGAIRDGSLPGRIQGSPMEPVFRRTSNFNTKPKTIVGAEI